MKLYEDIRQRTGGNIYLGITGPVRTGKSTLVKRMMETLVIPKIENEYQRERAMDELPQSGSGRTIMTAEPKFVPEEAVTICPDGKTQLSVRLIDSVGYMVPGALGAEEDGKPRMVTTPWFDHEIPMTDAAELGTKKVMENHCTVGLVVTTDGSVTDLSRADYAEAERRAITDMKATGKPFLVLVNSTQPQGPAAEAVVQSITEEYGVGCCAVNAAEMNAETLSALLEKLLCEFPLGDLRLYFPSWFDALETDHPLKERFFETIQRISSKMERLSQAGLLETELNGMEEVAACRIVQRDLSTGAVTWRVELPERLFYEVLSEKSGVPMHSDAELLRTLTEYRSVREEYDHLASALEEVRTAGYGIVMPDREEVELSPPELLKKGSSFGVKIKATAPSIHLLRTDIVTELSPMVGDETQAKELVERLTAAYDEGGDAVWESNLFGKTLYDLVRESMNAKIVKLPADSRFKVKNALTRIVNEGANGLICLIL